MKDVLIAYATRTGATREVAETIADELRRHGLTADVREYADASDPEGYEAIILGSGVRMRRIYKEADRYMAENASTLIDSPTALFTVSLTPVVDSRHGEERSKALLERIEECHPAVTPFSAAAFPGVFRPELLSAGEREILRIMGAKEGDYIDEAQVREWAASVAAVLVR
ncbi:MAG: flavodoxin domain-containing protein [Coriobacteriales bacterium]|nr:flavodoxin domain-containing protein [Coriobacteriales bacterium]